MNSSLTTISEEQDLREEKVNSITHALGILFGLVGIPYLIYKAANHADMTVIAGAGIYAFSFLMVFTFSTLFHWQRYGKLREKLKMCDHISIYFLIAGTYTPFILLFVNNSYGMTLLYILWGLALAGTLFKIFFTGKFEILSTIIYIIMGWMLLTGADVFFEKMSTSVMILIILGGCLYSVGVMFYIWRWFAYHHAVWHLFVLAAAICHFTAVFIAVNAHMNAGNIVGVN